MSHDGSDGRGSRQEVAGLTCEAPGRTAAHTKHQSKGPAWCPYNNCSRLAIPSQALPKARLPAIHTSFFLGAGAPSAAAGLPPSPPSTPNRLLYSSLPRAWNMLSVLSREAYVTRCCPCSAWPPPGCCAPRAAPLAAPSAAFRLAPRPCGRRCVAWDDLDSLLPLRACHVLLGTTNCSALLRLCPT